MSKSSERVSMTLSHQEPDRIPFDLGGTGLTTLHVDAYRRLREYLAMPPVETRIMAMAEQLAHVDEDVGERLQTDFRLVSPNLPSGFEYVFREEGDYEAYTDEWGIAWRKSVVGGFYYDMYYHPLANATSLGEFKAHPFPNPVDDERLSGLRQQAEAVAKQGKAVVLAGPCAGIAEVYSWMRGYEAYYTDLALNQEIVAYMLDRMVEFKCAYWEKALEMVGDLVDVVVEADDIAGQQSLLLSPRTYRSLIKPRHQRLFGFIKDQAEVKVFFHSCGAIRPLLPDLIDAGIDILNPVQISAVGMDPRELKEEFGCDLVFWGGGVDTQGVLGSGTPQQVRDDVRRNIDALAPGGGFVFATVHDIQADVPPENIMAMWETLQEAGAYL